MYKKDLALNNLLVLICHKNMVNCKVSLNSSQGIRFTFGLIPLGKI